MSVGTAARGNICVLEIDGELTGADVKQFRQHVEQAFADDVRDFVVDFAQATRIDSEGLEALTALRRECDDQLGMVKLCHITSTLKTILEITRIGAQFEQHDLIDDAVESFA